MSTGTTNFFFSNYKSSQEQQLIEDLVTESISIYGVDTYYIPRKLNNYNSLYGADDFSSFVQAIPVCVYIEDVFGFQGDGNFFSKLGTEIRDQVIFCIAVRTFNSEVSSITTLIRPNEGDLLYFPQNNKCYQIRYTDKYEMFYQFGAIQSYKLTCELFEYSNEVFNTGIPEIDSIQAMFDTNALDFALLNEDGLSITDEDLNIITLETFEANLVADDTNELNKEADSFIDFSVVDPFSSGVV